LLFCACLIKGVFINAVPHGGKSPGFGPKPPLN